MIMIKAVVALLLLALSQQFTTCKKHTIQSSWPSGQRTPPGRRRMGPAYSPIPSPRACSIPTTPSWPYRDFNFRWSTISPSTHGCWPIIPPSCASVPMYTPLYWCSRSGSSCSWSNKATRGLRSRINVSLGRLSCRKHNRTSDNHNFHPFKTTGQCPFQSWKLRSISSVSRCHNIEYSPESWILDGYYCPEPNISLFGSLN